MKSVRFIALTVLACGALLAANPVPPAPETGGRSEAIKRFIEKEAERRAASVAAKLEDKAVDALKEFLDQKLNKLDGGVKGAILTAVIKQREHIAEMAKASGEEDYVAFNQNLNLLIGKAILDNVPAGGCAAVLKSVTGQTKNIARVSNAAGDVAGGQYWDAVEMLGKAYSESTPIYRWVTTAAKAETVVFNAWTSQQWESAYELYKKPDFTWEKIEGSAYFGEIKAYLRQNLPDGTKLDDSQLMAQAQKMFKERQQREVQAEVERKRLEAAYVFFTDQKATANLENLAKRFGIKAAGDPELFRQFLKLLKTSEGELARMGLKVNWYDKGKFIGQPELIELLVAYNKGGMEGYRAKLAEMAKRVEKYPVSREDAAYAALLRRTKVVRILDVSNIPVVLPDGSKGSANSSCDIVEREHPLVWNGNSFSTSFKKEERFELSEHRGYIDVHTREVKLTGAIDLPTRTLLALRYVETRTHVQVGKTEGPDIWIFSAGAPRNINVSGPATTVLEFRNLPEMKGEQFPTFFLHDASGPECMKHLTEFNLPDHSKLQPLPWPSGTPKVDVAVYFQEQ